jgi:hypothetical protein
MAQVVCVRRDGAASQLFASTAPIYARAPKPTVLSKKAQQQLFFLILFITRNVCTYIQKVSPSIHPSPGPKDFAILSPTY